MCTFCASALCHAHLALPPCARHPPTHVAGAAADEGNILRPQLVLGACRSQRSVPQVGCTAHAGVIARSSKGIIAFTWAGKSLLHPAAKIDGGCATSNA